jgi:hypothetical protein
LSDKGVEAGPYPQTMFGGSQALHSGIHPYPFWKEDRMFSRCKMRKFVQLLAHPAFQGLVALIALIVAILSRI